MKLGGHCVLFGPAIAQDTEGTLGKLAFAGAEGCEIGERFFGTEGKETLVAALNEMHIELAGMHCNGLNLPDLLDDPEKSRQALLKTARLVADMPNKNIIATGATGDSLEVISARRICDGAVSPELHCAENARTIARNLNTIARELREEYGVTIHYHNHSWEFADNGLLWFAIADEAPDVCFALDTGWAAVSGFDPCELLTAYAGRFHYVHLRDYTAFENAGERLFSDVHQGFVTLGTGAMNYPRLMRCLERVLGREDWAIVEYEKGNFDQNSYLRAISYLRGIRDVLESGD